MDDVHTTKRQKASEGTRRGVLLATDRQRRCHDCVRHEKQVHAVFVCRSVIPTLRYDIHGTRVLETKANQTKRNPSSHTPSQRKPAAAPATRRASRGLPLATTGCRLTLETNRQQPPRAKPRSSARDTTRLAQLAARDRRVPVAIEGLGARGVIFFRYFLVLERRAPDATRHSSEPPWPARRAARRRVRRAPSRRPRL